MKIPYCTGFYTLDHCKQWVKELRLKEEYVRVWHTNDRKGYGRIWVEIREEQKQ